jgi:hypothetical protein
VRGKRRHRSLKNAARAVALQIADQSEGAAEIARKAEGRDDRIEARGETPIHFCKGMLEPEADVFFRPTYGSHATLLSSLTYGGTIGQTQFFATGRFLSDNVGIENPTSS